MRLLGVDLGTVRIGLAMGDSDTGSVTALATVRRREPAHDATTLSRLVAEQRIDELVVGLPLSLDGSEGPQASHTREWAAAVESAIGLPLCWRDERMTTENAIARVGGQRRGRSGGAPSASARRAYRSRLDQQAAMAIVQAELDARAGS